MRAIFILYINVIILLTGCAPVQIAKEVTKATQSLEASVKKIFQPKEEKNNISEENNILEENNISEENNILEENNISEENKILIEKKQIDKEQKKATEVVLKQKKVATIVLIGKTLKELDQIIGPPQLIRKDGKTTIVRFDSQTCRLFIFMKSTLSTPRVEYYEIRDEIGKLVDRQKDIEFCFNEIKLV